MHIIGSCTDDEVIVDDDEDDDVVCFFDLEAFVDADLLFVIAVLALVEVVDTVVDPFVLLLCTLLVADRPFVRPLA